MVTKQQISHCQHTHINLRSTVVRVAVAEKAPQILVPATCALYSILLSRSMNVKTVVADSRMFSVRLTLPSA